MAISAYSYKLALAMGTLGFSDGTSGKESPSQCRRQKRCRFSPWVRKIPWRREWQPTPVFLPGESHGWRSLAGYSPWGYKESDIIERLISRLMSTLPRIESCAAIASDLQQPLERCSRKRSGMRHSEIGKNLARQVFR